MNANNVTGATTAVPVPKHDLLKSSNNDEVKIDITGEASKKDEDGKGGGGGVGVVDEQVINVDRQLDDDIEMSKETTRLFSSVSDEEDGLVRYNRADHYYLQDRRREGATGRKQKAYPREWIKTLSALIVMCASFVSTTFSLSIVHEYMPESEPLPDIILDNVSYQEWALKASEIVLQIQVVLAIVIVILHRHRTIVFRRVSLVLSLLYGYRAVTMAVTILPKSNPAYYCSPKLSESDEHLTFVTVLVRVVNLLSGFGLTINGKHTFCGDFIFSGHTMTLVLSFLIVHEYTSRRLWLLHWSVVLSTISGVSFLMIGRGHYTIDILVAYWITTRLWYVIHAMVCHEQLKHATSINYLTRLWWWPIWRWFEGNVRSGPLPHGFDLPTPTCVWALVRKARYYVAGNGRRAAAVSANLSRNSSSAQRSRRKLKDVP